MHSRKNLSSRVNQRASSPWPSLSAKEGEGVSVSERCRRNVTKIVVLTLDCRTNLRDSLQRRRRRRRPIRRTRPTARTATCACVRAAYHTRDRQRPPCHHYPIWQLARCVWRRQQAGRTPTQKRPGDSANGRISSGTGAVFSTQASKYST